MAMGHAPLITRLAEWGLAVNTAQPEVVEVLRDLVKIPSPSGQEGEIAGYIADRLRNWGLDQVLVDENHNVVARVIGKKPGKSLVLLNHTDAASRPGDRAGRAGEIVDGRQFGKAGEVVMGPGAAAPKAAVAAMMVAAGRLTESRPGLSGTVILALVTKDLFVNHDGVKEVADHLKGATFGITAEPSDNNIVLGARGIMQMEVVVDGQPTHWSIPNPNRNALYLMGEFLEGMKQLPIIDDQRFGPTGYNPVLLEVEATPPLAPSKAKLTVDRRVLPEEDVAEIAKRLEATLGRVAGRHGDFTGRVRVLRQMLPLMVRGVDREKALLHEVIAETTGRRAAETVIRFGSNSAYLYHLGIPALVLGPGNIGDVGPDEHAEIAKVCEAVDIYHEFARRYLSN